MTNTNSQKASSTSAGQDNHVPTHMGAGHMSMEPTEAILAVFTKVYGQLRDEFGEAVFRSWLKPMKLQAWYQGTMEIAVPTRFMCDWIKNHYQDRMLELFRAENTEIQRIQLIVQVSKSGGVAQEPVDELNEPKSAPHDEEAGLDDYLNLSAPLDPRFTFDSFIVGQPNAFAHAAARRVADSPDMPFNPLYIYGGVGLGKTHLMHAIAWTKRQQNPKARIVYLSAEKFMYQFIRALRSQDSMAFKRQFRSVDVLMIDDIQFIANKESTQEEFFHTFNALVDAGKQIIISGDRGPMDLDGLDERLKSRLGWGLVADIRPSTFDLRLDVVKLKAGLMNLTLPDTVAQFLAGKITANIRELEGALNRLAVHADISGKPITMDMTQDALGDVLRSYERRVTIDEIQRKVAEHYGLKLADMYSVRRSRNVARPRQVAMYLCKKLTPRSLPEIGRKFGGRDHTTVMHAVRKIEELIANDPSFADDVNTVRRVLKGD